MQADWRRICVDGNPLVCHQLLRVGDDRWYWYQRYHHLLVDGFSFPAMNPADRRHLSRLAAEATPECAFHPFAEVVDEYLRYAGSEASQQDKAWQAQRQALPAPASLSAAPLGGRAAGRYLADEAGDERRRLPPPGQPCAAVSAR